MGDRAFGAMMLIFALPNILPLPPGTSAFLGAPIVLFSGQLALGYRRPWVPRWLAARSMTSADFRAIVERILPVMERGERLLHPRLMMLTARPAEQLLGALCFILAVVLALPIPLGNLLPGLSISIIALGLIEHDGLAIVVGVVIGVVSLAIGIVAAIAVVVFGLKLLERAIAWLGW